MLIEGACCRGCPSTQFVEQLACKGCSWDFGVILGISAEQITNKTKIDRTIIEETRFRSSIDRTNLISAAIWRFRSLIIDLGWWMAEIWRFRSIDGGFRSIDQWFRPQSTHTLMIWNNLGQMMRISAANWSESRLLTRCSMKCLKENSSRSSCCRGRLIGLVKFPNNFGPVAE